MTKQQQAKLKKLGDKVLDFYKNPSGELVLTMKYGSKYFCKTFMGIRGGMTYKEQKIYRNYSKQDGLTVFMFKQYI